MAGGRPPKAGALVDKFDGSREAKKRLRLVLDAAAGRISTARASELLGVSMTRFHQIQAKAVGGALEALEEGQDGRPPKPVDAQEVRQLRAELAKTQRKLALAETKAAVALVFPDQVDRGREKKRLKNRAKRRRKAQK